MKKIAFSILAAGLVLSWGAGALGAENKKFQEKANDLNTSAAGGRRFDAAIHAISVETGVPEDRLLEMHRRHPRTGPAGVLSASVLADQTKLAPEEFLNRHDNGANWEDLARKYRVPIEKLDSKLNHVQHYVDTGKGVEPVRRREVVR